MDRRTDVLLIGGGIAAATAAAELRERGFGGTVTLVTRERDAPYHRPPITKELLGPDAAGHDLAVHPDGWWADHDVTLLTRTPVTALDLAGRTAKVASGEALEYGAALLATGAMVRRLTVDGAALDGVHYLRAPGNAHRLRADAAGARRAVLVGGSFVATEVAASLTRLGVAVTMIMPERAPLATAFGPDVGDHVAGLLRGHGVELVCGAQVTAFTGTDRVDGVRTSDGRRVPADLVVVGIGAVPDTKLAARAGLDLGAGGGIACDATLRTSDPHVYAAGDVCEYPAHGGRIRVEHEEHAAAQGATAARGLMGAPAGHRTVPYFWTDLADWARFEYAGGSTGWDTTRTSGSLPSGRFTVWYLRGDSVVAALTSGRPHDLDTARDLISAGDRVPAPLPD